MSPIDLPLDPLELQIIRPERVLEVVQAAQESLGEDAPEGNGALQVARRVAGGHDIPQLLPQAEERRLELRHGGHALRRQELRHRSLHQLRPDTLVLGMQVPPKFQAPARANGP